MSEWGDALLSSLDAMHRQGYTVHITIDVDEVTLCVCRPEWVTDNPYQARPLPTVKIAALSTIQQSPSAALSYAVEAMEGQLRGIATMPDADGVKQ